MNISNNQYYAFYLWDPATPSFVSSDKLYIGSKNELLRVAKQIEKRGGYPDTAKAIYDFFEGKTNAVHNVAYRDIPILTPVEIIEKSKMEITSHKWDHLNVWGFVYEMRFESATVSQIVISHNNKYFRCIKAKFKDLQYRVAMEKWGPAGDVIFGNDCVVESKKKDGHLYFGNVLYVVEDTSTEKEELSARINDESKIIYKNIVDEIMGDG